MKWSTDLALLELALDAIEQHEAKLLVWGLVDAALTSDELHRIVNDALYSDAGCKLLSEPDCTLSDVNRVIQRLKDDRLIFEAPFQIGYRSRMAESVRLFSRLRQLFPKHRDGDRWTTAPTLVADYRLLWRRRKYPNRNILASQALAEFAAAGLSAEAYSALEHRLGQEPSDWKLARFQVDATIRVLRGIEEGITQGTMVAAGTGSGKTLSFYLPALTAAAVDVKKNHIAGTRILAIYPRNELLKDQFAEVYDQCRKFDTYLAPGGGRKLTVGVLFGDTPYSLNAIKRPKRGWKKLGNSYTCPYFRCPKPSCGGEMAISEADIKAGNSRLCCRKCGSTVGPDEVALTRNELMKSPPDILFTSTEMLNQNMSNSDIRHVLGIGPRAPWPPSLVLLDEVHIYSGTYGAQIAYLLRRWSALTKFRSSFVGLSATLADAPMFFSSLTGLDQNAVAEISPLPEHMISEGAEYMMALRGDPVSRSALLSTSIQSLMLASRILDPSNEVGKRPFYGWRTFAFTDQMDATNRLYLDLLDAEGMMRNGQPARNRPDGGLAVLRTPTGSRFRYEGGQDWNLSQVIGHRLDTRHHVSRTTAYDQGVSSQSEIVIATAALEVGYDDPSVGVVLQHKAPRDIAQFLQRKGRGGRTRHMRPWTLMVLSDYGRDRLAYQAYEQYFDPELAGRRLPLGNRYILRMQAVYTLIDYLGVEMQYGYPSGSVWRDLSGPFKPDSGSAFHACRHELINLVGKTSFPVPSETLTDLKQSALEIAKKHLSPDHVWDAPNWVVRRCRLNKLVEILVQHLTDSKKQDELLKHLRNALRLTESNVRPLLWEHPRPLLLGAVPTVLRRLVTDWRTLDSPGRDYCNGAPLPEFIPATLFSDLSLPEVEIKLPDSVSGHEDRFLPVLQALSELAPGKVSRRFDQALWLALDDVAVLGLPEGELTEAAVDIAQWFDMEPQRSFAYRDDTTHVECAAYRPYAMKLRIKPEPVGDTSNARLIWRSQLFASHPGATATLPSANDGITQLVDSIEFQTHALQAPATVRRYAIAAHAQLRIKRNGINVECEALWKFERDGKPCGIGFELEADAVVFKLRPLETLSKTIDWSNHDTVRAVRYGRYAWESRYGQILADHVENVFRRDWLAQIFLTAASLHAIRTKMSLTDSIAEIGSGNQFALFGEVLEAIFQSPLPADDNLNTPDRLRQDLEIDLASLPVLAALVSVAQLLVQPIDSSWDEWLEIAVRQTLAAALLDALQQFCPDLQTDQLVVDIEPGLYEDGTNRPTSEIWITEANPGGNGLIEQFYTAYSEQSERFFRLVEAALRSSEFEVIDAQLRDVVSRLAQANVDPELRAAVQAVRTAQGIDGAEMAFTSLRRILLERGFSVFHGFTSALSTRLLRRDMPEEFDELINDILERWDDIELTLGTEVDARLIAALYSEDTRIETTLTAAGFAAPDTNQKAWRFSVVYGLLWARGNALRSAALHVQNRFSDRQPYHERLLLAQWLSAPERPIDATAPDWKEKWNEKMCSNGRVAVVIPISNPALFREVIAWSIAEPVQLEYLNLYARLIGLHRSKEQHELLFELPESM